MIFSYISLKNSSEYKSAGVPMLPVVHGNQKTKEQILIYSVILFGICLLSCLGWRDLFSSSVKRQILETLIKSDRLEDFIHVKFKGAKRFSVEGSDSAVYIWHVRWVA